MLKLLAKLMLLLFIVLISCLLIRTMIPTYWHDDLAYAKEQAFEAGSKRYNTLFVGNSRYYRGVSPGIFDKNVKKSSSVNTHTFNYAWAGCRAGENFRLVNDIIDDPSEKLKYLLVDLSSILGFIERGRAEDKLTTLRSKYWLNWDMFVFSSKSVRGVVNKKYNFANKKPIVENLFVSYVQNVLNAGMFEGFLIHFSKKRDFNYKKVDRLGIKKDGFHPYPTLKRATDKKKNSKKPPSKELQKRADAAFKMFDKKKGKQREYNKPYLDELKALIKEAEEKDIHLIYIVPPLIIPDASSELSPIYFNLPEKNRIDLTSGDKYPGLYKDENCYDPAHLNKNGAKVFSRLLADKFVKLVDEKEKKSSSTKKGKSSKNSKKGKKKKKSKK